jgi:hypothetical protein
VRNIEIEKFSQKNSNRTKNESLTGDGGKKPEGGIINQGKSRK